jgi:hypothetical protein
MRYGPVAMLIGLALGWSFACATPDDDLGMFDAAAGGSSGQGGFGGGSGSGGKAASGGTGGTSGSGASSGFGGVGGVGGGSGSGGLDGSAGVDAGDSGSSNGFGPCVTQQEIDAQSTGALFMGFCPNPFGVFACAFVCPDDAVMPGDLVCSPICLCAPLPPLCGSDAGVDGDAADDAAADASIGDASDAALD